REVISPPTSFMSLLYCGVYEAGFAQKITVSSSATRPTPLARASPHANSSSSAGRIDAKYRYCHAGEKRETIQPNPSVPTGSRIISHIVWASFERQCLRLNRYDARPMQPPSTSAVVARSPPIRFREIWTGAPKFGAESHGEPVLAAW